MSDPTSNLWQETCDRYAVEIDMAIRSCLEHNPADRCITVLIDPDDALWVGTRADMDMELRSQGGLCVEIADHINACPVAPDGLVLSAIAHVIVLQTGQSPEVGEMPVYAGNSKGGSA